MKLTFVYLNLFVLILFSLNLTAASKCPAENEWKPATECILFPEMSCKQNNGVQKYERIQNDCFKNSTLSSNENIYPKRLDVKYKLCTVSDCKEHGTNPNGFWTEWDKWNCKECLNEPRLAKRKRICLSFHEGTYCLNDDRGIGGYEMVACDEVCQKGEYKIKTFKHF